MKKLNFRIKNHANNKIDIDLFTNENSKPSPLIIFAHGFKGFKDWGGFPYLMENFAEAGVAAVSFNFSLSGVSNENPMEFTRLDLFAQNTHSKELDDLQRVIDYFYDNAAQYNIDKNKIALAGHSRGGGAVILKSAEDNRIKSLVTLSSIATVNRWTPEQKSRWREKGYIEIPNARTGQIMRMNKTFLDDIEQNYEKLNLSGAMKKIKIPTLIVHGKEDLAVKYTDALALYENSNKHSTELYIIEHTGHTYGIEHPFKKTTGAFENVIKKSIEFLNKNMIIA